MLEGRRKEILKAIQKSQSKIKLEEGKIARYSEELQSLCHICGEQEKLKGQDWCWDCREGFYLNE